MVTALVLLAQCGVISLATEPPSRTARPSARLLEVTIVAPPGVPAPSTVFTEDALRRNLNRFVDSECDAEAVKTALDRRYKFLGYVPTISVTCDTQALRVRVRESSATIDLITFDPADLSRIGVKPDPDFEEKQHLYPVPEDAPRGVLRGLLLTREGDLYNFERYRSDSEALARLGYAVAFIPGEPAEGTDYPRAAYLLLSLTPRAPGASSARKTNYLGGIGSYAPQAKGEAGLLYEKQEVFGALDRLSVSPTYSSAAGGSVAYNAPLLARHEAPRRQYDLASSVYSNYLPNRQLGTVQTNERQNGFSGTLGIRPLRFPPPHALRLEVTLRHEHVGLEQVPAGEAEGSTTSVEIGATYDWLHTYGHPSLSARLVPSFYFAVRAYGGERTFVRPGVDGSLHARYRSGIETVFHMIGGTIDRDVPSYELWSLGGPGSVRGFKEDSFLGRHMAALQAEIWFPFVRTGPVTTPPEGQDWTSENVPFEPPAARLFKWALFADGGAMSGTTEGESAAIAGAGLGVRFLVPHHPFVVKIDYGWGFGSHGGHAYPYVALAYRF
jgi:surface antigen Omp85-like protein